MSQPLYLTDETGNHVAVLLDIEEYEKLLEALEELDDIRAYKEAKAAEDETIPFEQAVRAMEQKQQTAAASKNAN